MFGEELDYYTKHNIKNINIFGTEVKNLYKNINLQIISNYECNSSCTFCIEKYNKYKIKKLPDLEFSHYIDSILKEYQNNNVRPVVSITGGEPLMFKNRINHIIKILMDNKVQRYGINTNAKFLNCSFYIDLFNRLFDNEPFYINVSRHHINDNKNNEISGNFISIDELIKINNELKNRLTLQSVTINNYIDSSEKIKEFMDHFIDKGFNSFSFRGLYDTNLHKNMYIDFFDLIEQISVDNDCVFIEQKVGDHYIYEKYKYKNKTFRLTYANIPYLNMIEDKEIANNINICRNAILFPDGKFSTSWTRHKKFITIK
jgi:molybdenum cofactor biosynthesis enzyme MoaA